jgi:hypothetical protein
MIPSFDIFKIDLTGDVLWRDTAESLVTAKVSIEKLASSSPGEYLIFDQKTGLRVLVTLPGSSARPGSQAILRSILRPVEGHTGGLSNVGLDCRYPYKQPIRRTS